MNKIREKVASLLEAIKAYYAASLNHESECVDEHNKCFEVLESLFGWDIESEENSSGAEYILKATDAETAVYLYEHVFLDEILHKVALELMELLDQKFQIGTMSLDEYYAEMKSSGKEIAQEESETVDLILRAFYQREIKLV